MNLKLKAELKDGLHGVNCRGELHAAEIDAAAQHRLFTGFSYMEQKKWRTPPRIRRLAVNIARLDKIVCFFLNKIMIKRVSILLSLVNG